MAIENKQAPDAQAAETETKTTEKQTTKVVNFRIAETDADAFRDFCASEGKTQAQGFGYLLHVMEITRPKRLFRREKPRLKILKSTQRHC